MRNKSICPVCNCNVGIYVFKSSIRPHVDWIECPVCGRYMIEDTVTVKDIVIGMIDRQYTDTRRKIKDCERGGL
jgi:hypothetical protein